MPRSRKARSRSTNTDEANRITAHDRELKDQLTGEALVRLLQDSPLRDVEIDHEPAHSPVRNVEL